MTAQIEIQGKYPFNFDTRDIELTGSSDIQINSDIQQVTIRYAGSEQKFTGGDIHTADNWTYHTFTQSGKFEEI